MGKSKRIFYQDDLLVNYGLLLNRRVVGGGVGGGDDGRGVTPARADVLVVEVGAAGLFLGLFLARQNINSKDDDVYKDESDKRLVKGGDETAAIESGNLDCIRNQRGEP